MSRRQTKGPRSMAYHEAGHAVDVSILDLVRKELRAGEKLIWADQAGPMARCETACNFDPLVGVNSVEI